MEAIPIIESEPGIWNWKHRWRHWSTLLEQREDQVFLLLTLLIGALVGLTVVAFIVVTERLGMRVYPA